MSGHARVHASHGLASLLLSVLLAAAATAADGTGIAANFEIDGDSDDLASGDPIDWASAAVPPMLDVAFIDDPDSAAGEADDVFDGSKENTPGEWRFGVDSVPQKSDIDEARLAARVLDGRVWLYASASRSATSGAMNLSFEFNQTAETFANESGAEVPLRSAGDLMVMLAVSQGGQVSDVVPYRWTGTREAGQWAQVGAGGTWLAATNHGQGGLARDHWDFVELAVDLTSVGIAPGCGGFAVAWVKTNSTMGSGDGFFKDDGVLKDRTQRHRFDLTTDRSAAATAGEAHGIQVALAGAAVLDESHASSAQAGAEGTDDPSPSTVAATPQNGVAGATGIETDAVSAIGETSAESTARAEAFDVRLLDGLVSAGAVRVSARAAASGRDAEVSAEGSSVERVLIDHDADPRTAPVEVQGSAANVVVGLDPAVFGPGSYVVVLERIAAIDDDGDPATAPVFTSTPPADRIEGGMFAAGLTVNGIRVHVSGGSVPPADAIVSQASADAAFPQSFACTMPQQVYSSAFVLSAQSTRDAEPLLEGFVRIAPATGGDAERQTFGLEVPGVLLANLGTSRAQGAIDALANTSTAESFAELHDVCVLPAADESGATTCAFEAQLVRANASARADGEDAGFEGSVLILDRDGHPLPTSGEDGPEFEIPGIARIFFDVREVESDPYGARSSGGTVSAVVIELLDSAHAGAVVRLAESQVGAFAPASTSTELPEPARAQALGVGALAAAALRLRQRSRRRPFASK